MTKTNNKSSENNSETKLLISFKFPPLTDVSGIVLAKRALIANEPFDIIHGPIPEENLNKNNNTKNNKFNEELEKLINQRIIVDSSANETTWENIANFMKLGIVKLDKIEKTKNIQYYDKIISRAWLLESHFLGLAYKLKHPETYWTSEFSDPLRVNLENKPRFNGNDFEIVNNQEFIDKVNLAIEKKEEESIAKFPKINKNMDIFLLGEYLPYIFADKIRFTNKNQRKVMLEIFPYSELAIDNPEKFKEFILNKSEIKRHPTLAKEFYELEKSKYPIDNNYINIAYFGTYLGKRHLEDIYYSFEALEGKYKDKIKFHCFSPNSEYLNKITKYLNLKENIKTNNTVNLVEFLNLTTKMDVLIVNDTDTQEYFEINPYLPSKLADYLGSQRDIWGICEKGSIMDSYDLKYKSYVNDYESSKNVLNQILKDKLKDELNKNKKFLKSNYNEKDYLKNRVTDLNKILEETLGENQGFLNEINRLNEIELKLANENNRLKQEIANFSEIANENKKLKDENEKIINSNSWKITKNFRKIGKKLKK